MWLEEAVLQLRRSPRFSDVVAKIGEYWGASIEAYSDYLDRQATPYQRKAIKDCVWGMIDLSGPEVALLDSPPLQRLRHIAQLGLCSTTFPTATHSRFQHTLGVIQQTERIARAVAARSPDDEQAIVKVISILRLAAILHDIGHLPLSHVSERFYSELECGDSQFLGDCNAFVREIRQQFQSPRVSLSEALSVAFVYSEAFYKLILAVGFSQHDINIAAALIIGIPPSGGLAFMKQIISDVLDADKLDYMFRDAQMTGVPLSVDLELLLYKLKCYTLKPEEVTEAMRKFVTEGEMVRVIGSDISGLSHAKDVILARALLYERVYHHHKILAAERVALRILGHVHCHPVALLREADDFFSERSRQFDTPSHPEIPKLLSMLSTRRLPERLFAVSYGFLVNRADKTTDVDKMQFLLLQEILNSPAKRMEFEGTIRELLESWMNRLGRKSVHEIDIWADSFRSIEDMTLDLQVRAPDGTLLKSDTFKQQATAFPTNPSALSYVYISGLAERDRAVAFIACEEAVFRASRVYFGRKAADSAKVEWARVEELKRNAEAAEPRLFRDTRPLRPRSGGIRSASGSERIRDLAGRFSEYSVPQAQVNVIRLRQFLDQFPERLTDPMLQVLEKFTFLTRKHLARIFHSY